jgi:drug/metabolite transporter (DMT)-like permease
MSATPPVSSPFARVTRSPAALLLLVGSLLGLNFPLGKLAGAAGIPPLVWAAVISTGAAATLGLVLVVRGPRPDLNLQYLRYFSVTALVSYAIPNALVFTAIPHLGSAYTAILFALSPMFTVAFSLAVRLRSPGRLELTGVAIGFLGTILVASARGEVGREVEWLWIGVGVLVPFSLAIGNVYRTLDLPQRADTLVWATGALGAAPALASVPGLVLLQVAASAGMFALFFQLQVVGGPVTLSQIGIVAAAVGVIGGTLGFGERYPAVVWIGIAIIAAGVSLTVRARMRA